MQTKNKVLFILKKREFPDDNNDYNYIDNVNIPTGLLNSAMFMNNMLLDMGVESKLVIVHDNNDIDREVTAYNPTHVIIEAIWVVPEKFEILNKLHPTVQWIIRLHSEVPFLAGEGMAMKWIYGYMNHEYVSVAANSKRMLTTLEQLFPNDLDRIVYLPNYYPKEHLQGYHRPDRKEIDIACFGAIRPLKNHLQQAIAAIIFADNKGKRLRFHINVGRIEMKGEPVLHNIMGLFGAYQNQGHELVLHKWDSHDNFVNICKTMDVGLQVTYTETFNIVAADLVAAGVPVVGTREIPWLPHDFCADPNDIDDIVEKLNQVWFWHHITLTRSQRALKSYCEDSKEVWGKYFNAPHKHFWSNLLGF